MAEKTLEQMREAVEEIRAKMAAAAREAGRDPAQVQLCAACKTRTAETVAASAALPIDVFGENHVQALVEKTDAQREKYYTHYTGRPWGLPENYDICINSARLGIERTAALLAEHCRELFSNPC